MLVIVFTHLINKLNGVFIKKQISGITPLLPAFILRNFLLWLFFVCTRNGNYPELNNKIFPHFILCHCTLSNLHFRALFFTYDCRDGSDGQDANAVWPTRRAFGSKRAWTCNAIWAVFVYNTSVFYVLPQALAITVLHVTVSSCRCSCKSNNLPCTDLRFSRS